MGDDFTFVDVTFASLAAPFILDDQELYGKGVCKGIFIPFGQMSHLDIYKPFMELRKTPAGLFVKRVYENHRRQVITAEDRTAPVVT